MRLEFAPYRLLFKEPSGTSRGVLTEKPTFLIRVYDEKDPSHFGIGEAAVFPGLSPEADGNYVWKLTELLANVAIGKPTDLSYHSSIQFGFEQALLDFSNGCQGIYFPSEFTSGNQSIEINGLIWMGDFQIMMRRIEEKIHQGFKCIKLKIGAIDWESELDMIRHIRQSYSENELMIRVDANGGFSFSGIMEKLSSLASLGVHSIEQPIKAGHPDEMAYLCENTPIPIALDEELIGKNSLEEKTHILDFIKPQYIILKPALCGGFSGTSEWIEEAEKRGIGWWITSALESNVGLNAIAQYTASIQTKGPQGLGTGHLFTNNFEVPLELKKDRLIFEPSIPFNYKQFNNLKWHK
ncbi:MAG: o-succinylbenzoate synthase [Muribaculaceae bacterium]|nr:o-succinylbenzoate synthase [Muribaculaceae bacterium]